MTVEAQTSAAKNLLVNVIKECIVNQADNKPTTFKDVRTFSDGQSALKSFDIKDNFSISLILKIFCK